MSQSLLDHEILDGLRELQSESDPRFFVEYLTVFMSGMPGRFAALTAAIAAKDAAKAASAAHAIKSSVLNLGVAPIADLCARMEAQGRAGSLEGASAMLAEVQALYARLESEIRALPEFAAKAA